MFIRWAIQLAPAGQKPSPRTEEHLLNMEIVFMRSELTSDFRPWVPTRLFQHVHVSIFTHQCASLSHWLDTVLTLGGVIVNGGVTLCVLLADIFDPSSGRRMDFSVSGIFSHSSWMLAAFPLCHLERTSNAQQDQFEPSWCNFFNQAWQTWSYKNH